LVETQGFLGEPALALSRGSELALGVVRRMSLEGEELKTNLLWDAIAICVAIA